MRGAKSNALFAGRASCNPGCPCLALIIYSYTLTLLHSSFCMIYGLNHTPKFARLTIPPPLLSTFTIHLERS